MTVLAEWIKRIFFLAMLVGCLMFLIPDGRIKKGVKITGSLMLLLSACSVLPLIDGDRLPELYARYRQEAENLLCGEDQNESLVRSVIEGELEAYIEEKAQDYIVLKEVSVVAQWSTEGYWYPDTVSLTGSWEQEKQEQFSALLERELGLGDDKQSWYPL